MLYFTAVWAGLIIICSVIGTAVLNRVQPTGFLRLGDRTIVAAWLGLVILATALLAASLIVPLSPLTGFLVAVGLTSASLVDRHTRADLLRLRARLSPNRILAGLGLAWLVAAITARSVNWTDTGLYHYGSIQWLANYGSTHGVALLLSNLGFTSAWFALTAPFNPALLDARATPVLNGFVLWLALLSFAICLNRILDNDPPQLSDWFLAAYGLLLVPIVILHPLFKVMLASPAPDISVMFLVGITTWSLMVTLLSPQQSPTSQTIPLILATGTMTIKLVAIPLLLVVGLCYLTTSKPTLKRLGIGSGLASLVIGPFVASSLITSGCPLYPSPLFCLTVPWAPSQETIQDVAKATHSVTSWIPNAPPGIHPWLWAVWRFLSKDETSLLLLLVSVGAIVFMGYTMKRFQHRELQLYAWVTGIVITGMTFLLLTAPFSRFTLPYVILILALTIATVGRRIGAIPMIQSQLRTIGHQVTNLAPRRFWQWPVILILILGIGIRFSDRWILPPPMQSSPVIQKRVNNITYWSPVSGNDPSATPSLCWSAPLPCAFDITPDVWLRDPSQGLAGGFVRR